MPKIDMPLRELETYMGSSPKPADFDRYWTCALAEMHETDPAVELLPSAFQVSFADCHELYFTGVQGARIHAKYLRPKNASGKLPVLLFFHGYGDSSGDWFDKLPFAAAGFGVLAMDCRGQGFDSEDPGGVRGNTWSGHLIRGLADSPEKLMFRQLFLDAAELAEIAMTLPDTDTDRIFATGGSQGGALSLACAALVPRVSRVAVMNPFLCDYKRVWETDKTETSYSELKQYFRLYDPLHINEDVLFERLGYIDVQNLADRIRGYVLMGTGLMDCTSPASAQFSVYNKITAPKKHLVYQDFGHEYLWGWYDSVLSFFLESSPADITAE